MNNQPSTSNQQLSTNSNDTWTKVIESKAKPCDLKLRQLWQYRDLIYMFVRKDLVVLYKQTILGPIWYIVQPVIASIMFTFIFGRIAKIPSDGVPHYLFYLAGITCWGYFSSSLTTTSNTFTENQAIFGKVYFPRIVIPISIVISNFIKFNMQVGVFLFFYFLYMYKGAAVKPNYYLFLFPLLVFMMGGLSLGFGMLFSAMTAKYRDLKFLLSFFVQIWMYGTPIIYSLSDAPEKYKWIIALNPMTSIIITFKYAFLGRGNFSWDYLIYSFVFMTVLLFVSLIIFNKVEKNFMDTV